METQMLNYSLIWSINIRFLTEEVIIKQVFKILVIEGTLLDNNFPSTVFYEAHRIENIAEINQNKMI